MPVLSDLQASAVRDSKAFVRPGAISVSVVGKTFSRSDAPALRVLDGISFTVSAGRITAILGPSGCGKSTLLNMIAGLMSADQGEVCLEGINVRDFTDWRHIGYLFQDDRLLPWRTALENVEFGLEAERVSRTERRERAGRALSAVGLDGFFGAYPNALSGGMRSRVALARSLVKEPRILLLDEPFSKLDPSMRAQMHAELLQAQAERGITAVFVTHDIEEAVILADEVVVLQPNPGRVRAIVSIDLARPRHAADDGFSEQQRALRALL